MQIKELFEAMPITTSVTLPDFHPFLDMDVPSLFARSAQAHADRPLMVWEPFDGATQCWTYAMAHADMLRIAAGLAERGVGAGDAVILHLENSPESVLAWLACAHLGAVAITTNVRSAGEELAYFAQKSEAVGIITQPAFAEMVRAHLPDIGWISIAAPADGSLFGAAPVEQRRFGPEQPLCVQFTSGTTARPKGVLWTHANGLWGAMVNARHQQIRPDDVSLITGPLFHTAALAWQALASIWVGASFVIQPKFSASRFWPVVLRNGCTWATIGPFAGHALKAHPVPATHPLRFNSCGVSLTAPPQFFGIKSFGAHGMTELITQPVLNDPLQLLDEGSMGRPAPEYEVRIINEEDRPVAAGETGELQVRGIAGLSLFAEYLGDPEATADAFTADGFFRTGDRVTLRADGAFVFADRMKDMLKVGGENVAASEIEAVIRSVPGVKEVAVVGQPHPMLSEVPVAFIIASASTDNLVASVESACADRLADFKRPRAIHLVDDLPRSVGAKVAKAQLRALLKDQATA